MDKDTAIKVDNLGKVFRVPHEKHVTLKSAALNSLRKKSYTEFQALKDVSFEVKKGEFFGIIGRNGCGKSTLLKIIAGIYVPSEGKINIEGRISPFLELGVGFNMELTARENVFLGGSILGLTRKEIRERFDDIIRFSELEDFLDMKLKNFSSGMQVRLAFSLTIYAHAEILLMDEVLAVGDTNFQRKCLGEFNKYREEGKTVVLVTHDVGVVQRYCDRAMLIRKGQIEMIGNPEKVAGRYLKQNLKDEEKRMDAEKKAEVKNEFQIGKSTAITKVETFNRAGEKVSKFKNGQDICVRVYYRSKDKVINPLFGISIDREDGTHVIGPNTKRSHFNTGDVRGRGYIELVLNNPNLNFGVYHITAALFSHDEKITHDFKQQLSSFKIETVDKKQDGAFRIEYEWQK